MIFLGKWNSRNAWYSLALFYAGMIVGGDFATSPWFKPFERTVLALVIAGALFLIWKDRKAPKNP